MCLITKDYGRAIVRLGAFLLLLVTLVVTLFVLAPAVAAQTPTATLSGQVRDESGGTLPDVQVIVVNASTGLQRQTSSDADGRFVLPMLPTGRYVVTAQLQGFAPAQIKDLVLNPNDQATIKANGSSAFGGAGLPALLDSSRSTWRAGAWLTDRWKLTPKLTVEPGLRLDWSGLASEVVASPRLALVADLDDKMRLRVAGGLFTQSPGYEKLLQSDYFLDLSNAESLGLRSERAWHALVGLERTIGPGLVARVEGYYKRFDRLIVGHLETPEALAARIATYDFPVELRDQIPGSPIITSIPGNDGTGRAYGVEFYVARQALSSTDRISGWLSYTWGKAEQTAYGRTYAADYDRPHALSLVANYRLSRLIELGTTFRVQSGFPYSTPLGVRVAATEDRNDFDGDGNLTELIPQRDAEGYPVWTAEYGDVNNLNSGRLPLFARVDMRLTFRPRWQNNRWQLYMEVINVLNRKNAGVLETELVYDPSSDRPRLTTKPDASLPLLPTFGIRVRF